MEVVKTLLECFKIGTLCGCKHGWGKNKREAGVSPARTRRCNVGVPFQYVTGVAGKTKWNEEHKVRRPAYDGTGRPRVIG